MQYIRAVAVFRQVDPAESSEVSLCGQSQSFVGEIDES